MARQPDLFGYQRKRRPRPSGILMHAVDHGCAGYSLPEWKTDNGAHFKCGVCGFDDGWSFNLTDAAIKRGIPCPRCEEMGS